MIMAFEIFKKKKSEEEVEEEIRLPPELEHFKLQGPPFPKKAEPVREVEAPQRRPFVPEEYAEERFGPKPRTREPEEDRISIIIHKLDIIESRLRIIEEKLKK